MSQSSDVPKEDRVLGALIYLLCPWPSLLILFMSERKERPFIKAHYKQALVYGLFCTIVVMLLLYVPLGGLCLLPFWVAQFYWAYQAYMGNSVTIPVITQYVQS